MNNLTDDCVELAANHADEEVFALLDAARNIQGRLDSALDAVGLSAAKYSALDQLVRSRDPLTLSELAERLGCVRSNVTQLVDRLEADGLVERVSDPGDRRAIRAMVTPLGAERQAAGANAIRGVRTELASRLAPEERELFLRVLSLLR
ncbi:MAG TPA: MarR family transcriptional regulator [Gemmatimonadaceae bacterium]|nr:MarR family transcriptional regulator [Gemmatimonadaceae bacterium]